MSASFGANSRYRDVQTVTLTQADGTTVTYLKMRLVPPPGRILRGEIPVQACDLFPPFRGILATHYPLPDYP